MYKTFQSIGVSPIESSHSQPKRLQILKAKKKLSKVSRQVEKSFATVIGTDEVNISRKENQLISFDEIKLLQKKASDQDALMKEIKTKMTKLELALTTKK